MLGPLPKGEGRVLFPLHNMSRVNNWAQAVAPPESDVTLVFVATKQLAIAVAATSVRFTPNAAYDVDPVLGSTSTPGFAEWAAIYNMYRVVGVRYHVSFATTEATLPCVVYTHLSNTDMGTTANSTITGNALSKWCVLGVATGPSTVALSDYQTIATIVGTNSVETEDNYRALTNAVPADLTWLGCGAQTLTGGNFTGGVQIFARIEMEVRFFDRKGQLASYNSNSSMSSQAAALEEKANFYKTFESKRELFKIERQKMMKAKLPMDG